MYRQLQVPSKTFLIGEYGVLSEGPALILNTRPMFQLKCVGDRKLLPSDPSSLDTLWKIFVPNVKHNNSPVARLLTELRLRGPSQLSTAAAEEPKWVDPFDGSGGFGASSAQFLLVLMEYFGSTQVRLEDRKAWAFWARDFYLKFGTGSGADVVSQVAGQVAVMDLKGKKVQGCPWPWTQFGFTIFKTGQKIATHEHLKEIGNLDTSKLGPCAHAASAAFLAADFMKLCAEIQNFYNMLLSLDLVAKSTRDLVEHLRQDPNVLATKGCGAFGADAIVVLHRRNDQLPFVVPKSLKLIATERDLAPGISGGDA